MAVSTAEGAADGPSLDPHHSQASVFDREVRLTKDPLMGFGLSIVGGEPDPRHPNSNCLTTVLVSRLKDKSPAQLCGMVSVGDLVVAINGTSALGITHDHAVMLLKQAGQELQLTLRDNNVALQGAGDARSTYLPRRHNSATQVLLAQVDYERVEIMYNFSATRKDELSVTKGDLVHVMGRGTDGWCRGQCQRTKQIGMFPGNFAMRLRPEPAIMNAIYAELDTVVRPVGAQSPIHNTQLRGVEPVYEWLDSDQPIPMVASAPSDFLPLVEANSLSLSPRSPVRAVLLGCKEKPTSGEVVYATAEDQTGSQTANDNVPSEEIIYKTLAVRPEPPPAGDGYVVADLYGHISKRKNEGPVLDDIYATIDHRGTATEPPTVPERRYSKNLLPPTIQVALEATKDGLYEHLAFPRSHTDQGEPDDGENFELTSALLYERGDKDMPSLVYERLPAEEPLPPALPERGRSQRIAHTSAGSEQLDPKEAKRRDKEMQKRRKEIEKQLKKKEKELKHKVKEEEKVKKRKEKEARKNMK